MKHTSRSVYQASPVWTQNLLVTGQGALFRLLRTSDRQLQSELRRLIASERSDPEQRKARLSRDLAAFIRRASETTPYYARMRESGRLPDIWRAPDVLAEIKGVPLLEKQTVRRNTAQFYSKSLPREPRVRLHTSGTTGSPMETLETRSSMSRRFAFVARLRTWAGVLDPIHPRRIQFTGRDICQDRAPFWRENHADRARLFSTVNISPDTVEEYVRAMGGSNPSLMDGYPSAMLSLARLCKAQGIPPPQVPVIISTAETLTREAKEELETSFKAKVFNQYATTEPSCFWSTCAMGNMHIHEEYGLSEVLDQLTGEPTAPGDVGEVVVTSVLNPAMPLIRYRTGDLARLSAKTLCDCGTELPIVEEVIGRLDDILAIPGRGFVGRMDPVFKGLSGIVEAQIVQEGPELLTVKVVEDRQGLSAPEERQLVRNIRAKVGNTVKVRIARVPHIERGPNGKFRSVVSRSGLRDV